MKSSTKSNAKKFVEINDGPCAILISGLNTPYLKPLSCYIPDCLLPVANVPVLHYTLSQLISEGFKRIVIYAIHGSSIIRRFVKFQYPDYGFIEVQCGKTSSNLGDVMRDLDANESIRNLNEYVLMPADLHCSVSIMDLFNKFKKIKSENSSFVLSVAFAPASTVKSLKCNKISNLWYRKSDMKIVHFNKFGQSDYAKTDNAQSCSNLEDVCLWFCTKHIAPLFQENFDFRNSDDLIQGILINEDIINYMIHCTILNADRLHFQMVCDLPRLLVSTNLVLKRETSINHYIAPRYMGSESSFRLQPGSCNVYISPKSKIDRTVRLLGQCMISDGCEINANTVLINCTLGKNCIIGKNCKIRSLIALSGVEIMNNVVMDEAFICSEARILDGVKFQKKVFIGPSVVRMDNFDEMEDPLMGYEKATCKVCIGPNVTIPTRSVLMCPDKNVDILSEDAIGSNGLATDYDKYSKIYFSEDEMSDSDVDAGSDESVLVDTDVHNKPVDIWTSLSEVYESMFKVEKRYSRMNSSCKAEELDPGKSKTTNAVAGDEQSEEFLLDEMKSTFERCIAQNIEHSNTLLEFNSLKHAYAIGITDFCFFLIKALLEVVDEKVDSKAANSVFVKELRAHVEHFKTILETYFNNDVEAQSICLESIEDTCVLKESIMNRCLWILYRFYEEDILEEDEILKWYESSAMLSDEDTCEKAEQMRKKLIPFIKWLKEGSEASSSGSEESNDSEEDDN